MKIGDIVKYNGIYGLCIEERPEHNFCLFCGVVNPDIPMHMIKEAIGCGNLIIQLPSSPAYTLSLSDINSDILTRLSYSSSIRKVTQEDEHRDAISIISSCLPQFFNILSKPTQRTLLML